MRHVDSGYVSIFGYECNERNEKVLEKTGVVFDSRDVLPAELTAEEYWELIAKMRSSKNKHNKNQLLESAYKYAAELEFDYFSRLIGDLSLGNAKKVQIIGAIMHGPEMLIMDEPTSGLDPRSTYLCEQLIESLKKKSCIIVASHDIRWAQENADAIYIMHDGKIVRSGDVKDVIGDSGRLIDTYMDISENHR